jgi:alpha-L-fucosidase
MNPKIKRVVLWSLTIAAGAVSDAGACSALLLQKDGNVVIGHNFNVSHAQPTMVFINRRGTHKRSVSWEYLRAAGEIAEPMIEWRAKFGSVTFCCESIDFSTAGYNEAGLFVSDLYCPGSTWKPDPAKAKLHLAQWMQYMLDNCATVDEVIGRFDEMPAYVWEDDHVFMADKSGRTAVLEFMDGRPLITTGERMPVKAAVNCFYEDAIAGKDERFIRIKNMLARPHDGETPVDRVWRTLDACPAGLPRYPNEWQVVVDTKNRKIQFASIMSHAHKEIDLTAVDFSENARIKCMDVYTNLEGNVVGRMSDWTPEINARYTEEKSFPGEKNANIRAKLDRYCREYVAESQEESLSATSAIPWTIPADSWRSMRFGLFVHWGTASGRALPQSHSHARNSTLNPSGSVPQEVYDRFYKEFNPVNYDPDSWLKLAHDAGMRYAVFVAKHHDGFCMFKTDATDYNIMATPFGKDVAETFAAACQRQGLALGWQISPKDWKHPDFNTEAHDRYNAYYETLVKELASNYGPLSVMWFDGIEPAGPEKWKDVPDRIAAMLHANQPGIMLSNHGGCAWDFVSFETMVAPFDREHPWEMCEQINPSGWVFNKPMPTRPLKELLRNLVYTVSRDGNYLLDVGPMPDGRLYPPDAERLREFAAWMKVNAEGIHGTRGGPYRDGDWGGATCRGNAVYLFISDRVGSNLVLSPLSAAIRSARRLDGGPVDWKADSRSLQLNLSDRGRTGRPIFTCVKLELDRPAFGLLVIEGQTNLAAAARLSPSSIRDNDVRRWGAQNLFDNDGNSAWDTGSDDLTSVLDIDLGEPKWIGSAAISQRAVPDGYNGWFDYQIKARVDGLSEWKTVIERTNCLGCPPVLEFDPVKARWVRLEIKKMDKQQPVQVAEFRLFPPVDQAF